MQWAQPHRRAQFVYVLGIGKSPGTGAAVAGIVEPLRSETLRAILVHGDAVFEIRRMPRRSALLSGGSVE